MAGSVEWYEAGGGDFVKWPEDDVELSVSAAIPTAGSYIIRFALMGNDWVLYALLYEFKLNVKVARIR